MSAATPEKVAPGSIRKEVEQASTSLFAYIDLACRSQCTISALLHHFFFQLGHLLSTSFYGYSSLNLNAWSITKKNNHLYASRTSSGLPPMCLVIAVMNQWGYQKFDPTSHPSDRRTNRRQEVPSEHVILFCCLLLPSLHFCSLSPWWVIIRSFVCIVLSHWAWWNPIGKTWHREYSHHCDTAKLYTLCSCWVCVMPCLLRHFSLTPLCF